MIRFEMVRSEEQIAEVARRAREIWLDHYVPIIGREQVDYMLDKFQSERAVIPAF
jgi:diamine N-acetyltransferase